MKLKTALLCLMLSATSSLWAKVNMPNIICEDGQVKLIKKTHKDLEYWDLFVAEELSTGYIGAIGSDEEGYRMWVSYNEKLSRKEKADIIDEWDGNAGATLTLPKGTLKNNIKGKPFQAKLVVIYNDISQDEVENNITCVLE